MAPKKKLSKKVSFTSENNTTELPLENNEYPNGIDKKEKPVEIEKTEEEINEEYTHVVIQLPISAEHVENILLHDDMCNPFEYNPKLSIPTAYSPVNYFTSNNDAFMGNGIDNAEKKGRQPIQKIQTDTCVDTKTGY